MSTSDVLTWAGLAAFFACLLLLWWFARTEAEEHIGRVEQAMKRASIRDRERLLHGERLHGERLHGERLQRAILAGEVVTPSPLPPVPAVQRHPYDAPDLPSPVYFPYGSWRAGWQPPRLVPAAAATTTAQMAVPATPQTPQDSEEETYCPVCVCATLEPDGMVDVPLEAVVTPGMLDGSAVPHFCRHHCRALDLFTREPAPFASRGVVATSMMVYARRLIARVRAQQRQENRQERDGKLRWHLGEDGCWHRDGDGDGEGGMVA